MLPIYGKCGVALIWLKRQLWGKHCHGCCYKAWTGGINRVCDDNGAIKNVQRSAFYDLWAVAIDPFKSFLN